MQTRDLVNLFRWSRICILASSLPTVEDICPSAGMGPNKCREANINGTNVIKMKTSEEANINEIYLFE